MPSCNDTIFFLWNDENNNVLNKYCDLVKCFPYCPKIKFLSSSHQHPFDQVKKKDKLRYSILQHFVLLDEISKQEIERKK